MSYRILILLLVFDGLIFSLSDKVFIDRLTIILHTKTCDIRVHCAMNHK